MSTSLSSSLTQPLARASTPVSETVADQSGLSAATSEERPLELKRPELQPSQIRPEWGSTDYVGTSRSIGDLGRSNLDVVASFIPEHELRDVATREPAFQVAPLLSGVFQARMNIDVAEASHASASAQIARAQTEVGETRQHLPRAMGCMELSAVAAGVGSAASMLAQVGAATGILSSGTAYVVSTVGSVVVGAGCLPFLARGLSCARNAYARRLANQELVAGNQALTAAQTDLESARAEHLTNERRLRGVDLQSLELGEGLLAPR